MPGRGRCEECSEESRREMLEIVGVCKRGDIDIINFIASQARVCVTNLRTLSFLVDANAAQKSWIPPHLSSAVRGIRYLSIVLNLLMQEYIEIQHHATHTTSTWIPNPQSWLLSCRTLMRLHRLRTLHVWAACTDAVWSRVHERAFLSPLRTLRTNLPSLAIQVNLPSIHSALLDTQRHFPLHTTQPSYLTFTRRALSPHHAAQTRKGTWRVERVPAYSAPVLGVVDDSDSDEDSDSDVS
ncbi:hypothetical protein CC86DRAFT_431814 [Ophiobolus disseminans]|uniref:Uncharacterized protein n=1 Tax=Ophiobolus disseminans TaxID=1469910 RepID=A0A6A6ZGG2_9PLEO|nr:hypothetical protein CC86DRAFT_431814 [Ophiobolus disseminans]